MNFDLKRPGFLKERSAPEHVDKNKMLVLDEFKDHGLHDT